MGWFEKKKGWRHYLRVLFVFSITPNDNNTRGYGQRFLNQFHFLDKGNIFVSQVLLLRMKRNVLPQVLTLRILS